MKTMTHIETINEHLARLGVYPDLEACEVSNIRNAWVLSGTQEATVFSSPEDCSRALSLLSDDATEQEIHAALAPNQRDDEVIWWGAGYRLDPQAEMDTILQSYCPVCEKDCAYLVPADDTMVCTGCAETFWLEIYPELCAEMLEA